MNDKRGGFTLVEIMVVVVIIGLLATIVALNVRDSGEEARRTTTRAQISNIEQALELYHLNNGFFPTTDQGLQALVEKATTPPAPNNFPRGGYMKQLPKDGWKRDFIYKCPGDRGEYDIISLGADGKEGGEEFNADITNWDAVQ
ncbi:MAG: type II secretion system major pseudopilin GspG [Synergistaceae bacterium]|jgi:general secretion pathway protein G|nr:type II secretion system major pseudopilin GspG [Synergistaceae bacterium]